ncbi:MAG: 50S ribosomal protein L23 [Bacteroidetes bacterium CG02_land_8_20_14_3_00_31_25]|nr:50S ribosomal protein L23 [Bacteroidota bacterium]OFX30121.1 MAG: 50S ribosomal protein L23 [Bacteroidetes bacterium GWA2_32_17]PIV58904.1 MAG: 50S ribosomal protein L23 [Bacteroidetes bacterium CG02_land_8_20_14_3_00_31_25]PIX32287.1 MAG: 50S ribosomal protein L23 [Bacteroidetes bacterium CG_4_8_14_3_um_filter_31_14]
MDIIIRPIVTEKMNRQGDSLGKYGFMVSTVANKLQVRKAVEKLYGVTVESVNTVKYSGKTKTRNTRSGLLRGKSVAFKKAIVTLTKGEKIDFYSNI